MKVSDHIKKGDMIRAHGCDCLVLQVIPTNENPTDEDWVEVLSDDGRIWKTSLRYTKWSTINESR